MSPGHSSIRRTTLENGDAVEICGPYEDGNYLFEVMPEDERKAGVVLTAIDLDALISDLRAMP